MVNMLTMWHYWTVCSNPPRVPPEGMAPLIDAVILAARHIANDCEGRAGAYMTAVQARAAAHLSRAPYGLPAATLVERLGTTKQAVSGLIGRMERAGLIARTAHPFDGRSRLIQLTFRGADELEAIARRLAAFDRTLTISLGEGEEEWFLRKLARIGRDPRLPAVPPPPSEY